MALTLRTNGTGGGIVSAAWWNDFYNLMTGVMTDQAVTLGNDLTVNGILHAGHALSAANQIMDFEQGYGLYSDNAGSLGGSTRLWLNTPTGTSELHIGPRGGTPYLKALRLLTENLTVQSSATGGVLLVTGGIVTHLDGGAITTNGSGTIDITGTYTVNPVSSGGTWTWGLRVIPTGNTVSKDWLLIHDGASGSFFLYNNTDARTLFTANPNGVFAFGTNRSGTATVAEVYTGTATPVGDGVTTPRTGAIWVKA